MEATRITADELANKLFEKSDHIICDTSAYIVRNDYDERNINLSSIATKLIQATGRWCEAYASDFLISWDETRNTVRKHMQTSDVLPADVILFGMRRNGVDHNEYILARLHSTDFNSEYYRKVYGVQVLDYQNDDYEHKTVLVTLKDVTNEIGYIHHSLCTKKTF